MRKLKIAYLSLGSFTHVTPYIEFFRDRGHDVSWIAYDSPIRDLGVPTYILTEGAKGKHTGAKWRYLLAGARIRKLLRQLGPDLLHGHYVTSAGTICLLSGFRPYVLTAHGSDVIGATRWRVWRWILQRAFAGAALVNVVSDQIGETVRRLGVLPEKLLVSTLGIEMDQFAYQEPRPRNAALRLLCTRTLDDVYDPGTIVRACQLLKHQGFPFELTFAAGGRGQQAVINQVAAMGLGGQIRFLGGYANAALPKLLHGHDVYLSASLWDGTSLSLLEAMACGIFPIVSRIPSNEAWVSDGQTALMFNCRDHVALANAVRRIVGDEELRRSALTRNRRTVESRADRHKNMSILENHYYELAERRPVGASATIAS